MTAAVTTSDAHSSSVDSVRLMVITESLLFRIPLCVAQLRDRRLSHGALVDHAKACIANVSAEALFYGGKGIGWPPLRGAVQTMVNGGTSIHALSEVLACRILLGDPKGVSNLLSHWGGRDIDICKHLIYSTDAHHLP